MMNTQTIELDLSKDAFSGNMIRVGQGDENGTTLKANIYDNGEAATLEGYTAYLEVLLPNKRNYYRSNATISGNTVTCVLDESKLCSVAGYTDNAYFAFEKSGTRYSTERFAFEILRCVTEGMQPAQSWDDAINNIVQAGKQATAAANAAADNANEAATAANNAAQRVEDAVDSASDAASAANSAATAANTAAGKANSAASAANTAAGKANTAATSASDAASAANSAASAANTAADRANAAADRVDASIEAANTAASKANSAADDANEAAERANSASVASADAAQKALSIVNAVSDRVPGGTVDVGDVKADNAVLATILADLTDAYVVIDDTAFTPQSRVVSIEGETLTISNAEVTDTKATLS